MNKKVRIVVVGLNLFSFNIFSSLITEGIRSLSSGSVYTASNGEASSLFNNPAGLYGDRFIDIKLEILGNLNFTGNILLNIANIINNFEKFNKIQQSQHQGQNIDIVQIACLFDAIKNLIEIDKPGKGVMLGGSGGLLVKVKDFGLSIRNITEIGLKPHVDTNFYLGPTSSPSFSPSLANFSVLKFVDDNANSSGVKLTTATLKYENLYSTRDDLVKNVLPWLIDELEKMNIEIPQEIKDNLEGIANALINSAIDNGASPEDVNTAVNQLKDPYLQSLISNILHKSTTQTTLQENESGLILKGINYTELSLGYSYSIFNELQIGVGIKYFAGKTFYYNFKVFKEKKQIDFTDISSLEEKLIMDSRAIGLDFGAVYKLPLPIIETKVGLVIKNLIEPYFNLPKTNEKLKFSRQLKLGVLGNFKILKFGFDLDLNPAETFIKGYNIQNFSLGVEIKPPILPSLRLGYIRNLAFSNDQIFTAGLGFKFFVINFDLFGAFSPESVKINRDFTLPVNNLFLGLNLGVEF